MQITMLARNNWTNVIDLVSINPSYIGHHERVYSEFNEVKPTDSLTLGREDERKCQPFVSYETNEWLTRHATMTHWTKKEKQSKRMSFVLSVLVGTVVTIALVVLPSSFHMFFLTCFFSSTTVVLPLHRRSSTNERANSLFFYSVSKSRLFDYQCRGPKHILSETTIRRLSSAVSNEYMVTAFVALCIKGNIALSVDVSTRVNRSDRYSRFKHTRCESNQRHDVQWKLQSDDLGKNRFFYWIFELFSCIIA